MHERNKTVGIICHGGLVAISAGIVDGARATGSLGIKDDLENAGATWVDKAAFREGNLVWGRVVPDIPTSAANSSPRWPRSSGRGGYASGHTCIGALREREGSGCVLVSTWWILLLLRLRRVARALHILRVRIHYTKAPHCDGIECCIHYYESTSVGLCAVTLSTSMKSRCTSPQ